MQSSRERAGDQWNMPVESYFISVFSKSKSRAWSSAIPAWIPPPLCEPLLADPLLVGLSVSHHQTERLLTFKNQFRVTPHQVNNNE